MCVQIREILAETMHQVVEKVTGNKIEADKIFGDRAELTQHQCYKAAATHYKHECFNWHKTEVELLSTMFCLHSKLLMVMVH